jgi:hypothetical protein
MVIQDLIRRRTETRRRAGMNIDVWKHLVNENLTANIANKFFSSDFGPCIFLRWMKKPTNAAILQGIDTRNSATCFGTLKCHNQVVNHDRGERGAQCCRNQIWMKAVYCNSVTVRISWLSRYRHASCYTTQLSSISDFDNIGHLSQHDQDWLPDCGILKCRNM